MIKKRFFDVTFYKTFPFMDYYKNEEAFAKDLGMIKDMYPHGYGDDTVPQ